MLNPTFADSSRVDPQPVTVDVFTLLGAFSLIWLNVIALHKELHYGVPLGDYLQSFNLLHFQRAYG